MRTEEQHWLRPLARSVFLCFTDNAHCNGEQECTVQIGCCFRQHNQADHADCKKVPQEQREGNPVDGYRMV